MTQTIILADNSVDIRDHIIKSNFKKSKIFSFNIFVHKILEKESISHEMAENYISSDDRSAIYKQTLDLYDWYDKDPILKHFEFQNVNLFKMLDTAEFHQLIIDNLINFVLVEKILEKEKPEKIFTTKKLYEAVRIWATDKQIEVIVYGSNKQNILPWDKIQIKFNLGKLPISFFIERKKYLKITNVLELTLSKIFNLYFKSNNKKTVLLLEFDPYQYKNLLLAFKKCNMNVVFLNRRRTSLWSLKSIKSLFSTNCKIINQKNFLQEDKSQIPLLIKNYCNKLDQIFSDDSIFLKIFFKNNRSFWPCIKDTMIQTYKKRIHEYIPLLISSKRIIEKNNFCSILSLNIIGETEKSIIYLNNKIPFILLEHGFSNHIHELKKFDIFHMYPLLKDQIAVWGNIQKDYLIKEREFDTKRILITGSPRHDPFFQKLPKTNHFKKTVLITPHPISNVSGLADTNLYMRLENLLIKLCNIFKNIPNLEIIIKFHPGQDEYGNELITLLQKIDSKIKIFQLNPIIDLIESCDLLVNISPESFDTSTVIMEGLIMNKPVININLDDKNYDFPFVKDNAVISLSDNSDLENILNEVIFNQDLKSKLQNHGKIFLKKYLVNHGTASENLAKILSSY